MDTLTRSATRMPKCTFCSLAPLCFCDPPPSQNIENHTHVARPRILSAGRHLLHPGVRTDSIYTLREGSARSYELTHNGDERTIEYYLPGEPIAVDGFALLSRNYHVVALEQVAYCELPLSRLKPLLMSTPDTSIALIRLLAASRCTFQPGRIPCR